MGFFDKAKHFMGGHGVKVQHTVIERQDPLQVTLPMGDTVVKGKFNVTADKDCEVLSMKASFLAEFVHPDGRVEEVMMGADVFPEPNTSRSDDMLKYPYALAGGATQEDFFIIHLEKDIPTLLSDKQWPKDKVRFFVKTMVDVKGSPFDPDTRNEVKVIA
jgi:hypothetical protein